MLEKYGKAAIVHPTGTGKSYIAFKLIEDHPDAAVLWLSPSEYIFKNQTEELRRANPDFPLQNVRFYTYAKLMYADQDAMEEIASSRPEYIILDEFHRVGAARIYQAEHGDLNVPFECVTPEGIRLGQWIVRQREQWNKPKAGRAKLSADRKARLDAIGMRWNEQDPWQHRYNLTLQYKQDYGDLNIPAKYKTADGIWLGNWLYRQKRMLQDTPEALTAGQREQLCVLLARAGHPVKDSA